MPERYAMIGASTQDPLKACGVYGCTGTATETLVFVNPLCADSGQLAVCAVCLRDFNREHNFVREGTRHV